QSPHLAGNEGLEKTLGYLIRYTRACICDLDLYLTILSDRSYHQFALFAFPHGFRRISDEIDQDLLNLHAIDKNLGALRRKLKHGTHTLLARAHKSKRPSLFDKLSHTFHRHLRIATRDEFPKMSDYSSSAQ